VRASVTFAQEPLSADLWAEAMPLLVAHWAEVAHFKDIPLEPDLAVYRQADVNGAVRVFTARRDSSLVGYALFFVRANPHYASSVQAVQDVLYIAPECRGVTSYRFIRWCDEQLKAEGVEAVYQHSKAAHDFGGLLEHQGYELVDYIYAKRLR
jgi:hypothetical protein